MITKNIQLRSCRPHGRLTGLSSYDISYNDLDCIAKYCLLVRYELYPLLVRNSPLDCSSRENMVNLSASANHCFVEICKVVLEAAIALSVWMKKHSISETNRLRVTTLSAFVLTVIQGAQGRDRSVGNFGNHRFGDLAVLKSAIAVLTATDNVNVAETLLSIHADTERHYWNQISVSVAHCSITHTPLDLTVLHHWLSPSIYYNFYNELRQLEVVTVDSYFLVTLYWYVWSAPLDQSARSVGSDVAALRGALCALIGDNAFPLRKLRSIDSLVSSLMNLYDSQGINSKELSTIDKLSATASLVLFSVEVLDVLVTGATCVQCGTDADACDLQYSVCYQLYQVSCWVFGALHMSIRGSICASARGTTASTSGISGALGTDSFGSISRLFSIHGELIKYGRQEQHSFGLLFLQDSSGQQQLSTDIASDSDSNSGLALCRLLKRCNADANSSISLSALQCAIIAKQRCSACLMLPLVHICIEMEEMVRAVYLTYSTAAMGGSGSVSDPVPDPDPIRGLNVEDEGPFKALLRFRLGLQTVLTNLNQINCNGSSTDTGTCSSQCHIRMMFHVLLESIARGSSWPAAFSVTADASAMRDNVDTCCADLLLLMLQQFVLLDADTGDSPCCCALHPEFVGVVVSSSGDCERQPQFGSATLRCCLYDLGDDFLPQSVLDVYTDIVDWCGPYADANANADAGTDSTLVSGASIPVTPSLTSLSAKSMADISLEPDWNNKLQLVPVSLLVLSIAATSHTASGNANNNASLNPARNYLAARQLNGRAVLHYLCTGISSRDDQSWMPYRLVVLVDTCLSILGDSTYNAEGYHRSIGPFAEAIPVLLGMDLVRDVIDNTLRAVPRQSKNIGYGYGHGYGAQGYMHRYSGSRGLSITSTYLHNDQGSEPTPDLSTKAAEQSKQDLAGLCVYVVEQCSQQWGSILYAKRDNDTELDCDLKLLKCIQKAGTAYCRSKRTNYNGFTHNLLLNLLADCSKIVTLGGVDSMCTSVQALLRRSDPHLVAYYKQSCQGLESVSTARSPAPVPVQGRFSPSGNHDGGAGISSNAGIASLIRRNSVMTAYLSLVDAHLTDFAVYPETTSAIDCDDNNLVAALPVDLSVVCVHMECILQQYIVVANGITIDSTDGTGSLWENLDWESVIARWLQLQLPSRFPAKASELLDLISPELLQPIQRRSHFLYAPHCGGRLATELDQAVSFLEKQDFIFEGDKGRGRCKGNGSACMSAVCVRLLLMKDMVLGTASNDKSALLEVLSHIVFNGHENSIDVNNRCVISRYMRYLSTRKLLTGSASMNADALMVEIVNNILGMFFCDIALALLSFLHIADTDRNDIRTDFNLVRSVLPVLLPIVALLEFGSQCTSIPSFTSARVHSALTRFCTFTRIWADDAKVEGALAINESFHISLRTEPRNDGDICNSNGSNSVSEYMLPTQSPHSPDQGERRFCHLVVRLLYSATPVLDSQGIPSYLCALQCQVQLRLFSCRATNNDENLSVIAPLPSELWRILCPTPTAVVAHSEEKQHCSASAGSTKTTLPVISSILKTNFESLVHLMSGMVVSYWYKLCANYCGCRNESGTADTDAEAAGSYFASAWKVVQVEGCDQYATASLTRRCMLLIACANQHLLVSYANSTGIADTSVCSATTTSLTDRTCFPWLSFVCERVKELGSGNAGDDVSSIVSSSCSVLSAVCCHELSCFIRETHVSTASNSFKTTDIGMLLRLVETQRFSKSTVGNCAIDRIDNIAKIIETCSTLGFILLLYALALHDKNSIANSQSKLTMKESTAEEALIYRASSLLVSVRLQQASMIHGSNLSCVDDISSTSTWMYRSLIAQQCQEEVLVMNPLLPWRHPLGIMDVTRRSFADAGGIDAANGTGKVSNRGHSSMYSPQVPIRPPAANRDARMNTGGNTSNGTSSRFRKPFTGGNMMEALLSHTAPTAPRSAPGSLRQSSAVGAGGQRGRQHSPLSRISTPPSEGGKSIGNGSGNDSVLSSASKVTGSRVHIASHPSAVSDRVSGRPPTPVSSGSACVGALAGRTTHSPLIGHKRLLFSEHGPSPSPAQAPRGSQNRRQSQISSSEANLRSETAAGVAQAGTDTTAATDIDTPTETRWSPPKSFMLFSKLS